MHQTSDAPLPVELVPPDEIPPLASDATPEEKDAHWFRYVYQGDRMPQLTIRSVIIGGLLGMLLSASNLYTTLSIGWSFGVTITACVMSFVLWNLVVSVLLRRLLRPLAGRSPLVGLILGVIAIGLASYFFATRPSARAWIPASVAAGACLFAWLLIWLIADGPSTPMSILESNCMASTASAAGYSTGGTLATMFGALLLLSVPPAGQGTAAVKTFAVEPIWLVGTFTLLTGLMGVLLAIPMKRQMINHEQLPFPSGTATAETLKSLYSHGLAALRKAYAMLIGLGAGLVVGFLRTSEGTIGSIDRFFGWFHTHLFSIRLPDLIPAKGLFTVNNKSLIDFGFQPSGMLIGAGMIVGMRVSVSMLVGSCLLYFIVGPMLIHADLAHAALSGYKPSIELVAGGTIYHLYRWGLWGGTALMVFSSITGLALQWKTFARAFLATRQEAAAAAHHSVSAELKRIEVPAAWMLAGMIPVTIGMIILQVLAFEISWWAGLIAVGMSFVLSLVACRATGETDTTPIGAMGKVMQLIFAVLAPKSIVANLASAGIAANSAGSSADLLTDLKSGYLLGANPRKQFLAQFFGVFFGTLAIVPIWYLMIPTRAALEAYPAPATNMWYKVAQVLTEGIGSLPYSARMALFIGAIVGIALPLIERLFVPERYRKYYPSAMGLGLSWVVPFANAFSFFVGAVIAWGWKRISDRTAEAYTIPLASGLVAGESLYLAFIAITATILKIIS